MSDIKKICEAMAALAAAIPGAPDNRGSVSISLHGCVDATLRLLVDNGGRRQTYENESRTEEWDCVSVYVGPVGIHAYGKHRQIGGVETDSDAVDAALAKAQEALL